MKAVVAVLLGLLSGFLIYMTAFLLVVDFVAVSAPSTAFVLVTFVGGWAVSTYLLLRNVRSVSKVFTRGALLGAAEWIAVAGAGVVYSGRGVAHVVGEAGASDAATAGAAVGGGILAMLTGGIAVFMAVVCLIVFAIAYFTGREMQDATATPSKKCPECAEMIQPDARKCKHCGTVLVSTVP